MHPFGNHVMQKFFKMASDTQKLEHAWKPKQEVHRESHMLWEANCGTRRTLLTRFDWSTSDVNGSANALCRLPNLVSIHLGLFGLVWWSPAVFIWIVWIVKCKHGIVWSVVLCLFFLIQYLTFRFRLKLLNSLDSDSVGISPLGLGFRCWIQVSLDNG